MKKIQYAIARKETGNASGKAKKDAFDIALKMGFVPSYHPVAVQFLRVLLQIVSLPRFVGKKVIFFQYPAVSELLMNMFRKIVSKKSYKIALIHDLSSIQGLAEYERNREVEFLSIFDCLIVHNQCMDDYVKRIGYKGKTVILGLFDYLHDANHEIQEHSFSNSVSFAGNLEKAVFLKNIGTINCNWILYGKKGENSFENFSNVSYKGLLPSDEIQYLMEGDYGLVWDGDSIDTCAGPSGEYLRFNNPHKLSCCIAAGKPVITWRKAAIASFVEKKQIGITVDSLKDLNNIDLSNNYETMRRNVMKIKKEISDGKFLESAILKALKLGNIV